MKTTRTLFRYVNPSNGRMPLTGPPHVLIVRRNSGTVDRPAKNPLESMTWLSDIVGELNPNDTSRRAPAGEILKMIDISSASTAMAHADAGGTGVAGASCVTIAFDRVDLLVPILHGDLVRLHSRCSSVWMHGNNKLICW